MNRNAAVALTAAAALAVSLGATGLSGAQASTTAGRTPAGHTLAATPVSKANLPVASRIRFHGKSFGTVTTLVGQGTVKVRECQSGNWSASKPNASFKRTLQTADESAHAAASIASFSSHKAALAAADKMAAGFTNCGPRLKAQNPHIVYSVSKTRKVVLPTGQVATLVSLNQTDGESSTSWVQEGAIVVTGTHAEIISVSSGTQAPYGDAEVLAAVKQSVKTLA